jgi:hypothetical protein
MHPYALTLTLLIQAEKFQTKGLEEAAYVVIDKAVSLAGYRFERKADLYARIAEAVTAKDSLIDMQKKISACLEANDKEYPHG